MSKGLNQQRCKDYRLKDKKFNMIFFCSPYKRAVQTANLIATQIGFDKKKIKYLECLK